LQQRNSCQTQKRDNGAGFSATLPQKEFARAKYGALGRTARTKSQGSHTFSKNIFYAFSTLNEKTLIPSLILFFPKLYSWNTTQKNIWKTVIESAVTGFSAKITRFTKKIN